MLKLLSQAVCPSVRSTMALPPGTKMAHAPCQEFHQRRVTHNELLQGHLGRSQQALQALLHDEAATATKLEQHTKDSCLDTSLTKELDGLQHVLASKQKLLHSLTQLRHQRLT